MRNRVVWILALLLATLGVVSVGATGGKESTASTAAGAAPVTMSFFSFNVEGIATWDGPVHKRITERTGVKLAMEFIVGTALQEKVGIMIAGEEYADIIEARGLGVPEKLIEAGALIPLDDLIERHAPNLKKLWGDSLTKLRNPRDGKIYLLPQPANRPREDAEPNQAFLLQYDVLEKTGWTAPKTLDDVQRMLKAYIAKYPDLNGTPWVPWGLWADSWGYNITLNNAALWVNGFTDDSDANVDQKTYDVTYFNTTEYFKRYLKWLNGLYKDGLLDRNGFIMKVDQWRTLVASGRVLATIGGTFWDVADGERALRQAGMPERAYARLPVTIAPGVTYRGHVAAENYSWGLAISKNAKDPVRAIQFLDFLASPEGTVLLNWGVEGVHYDVVNGKRVMKPEVVQRDRADPNYHRMEGFGTYEWVQYFGAVRMDDGQYASPVNPADLYANSDAKTREVMDRLGIKFWGQLYDYSLKAPPYGYAWTISVDPNSTAQLAYVKADELRHALVPQVVMSRDDQEFDRNWDAFVTRLRQEAGIGDWEKAMAEGIRTRLKLYGILPN